MRSGKLIQAMIEEAQPAWKDKFLPYKSLKKRLHSLLADYIEISNERIPAPAPDCGSPENIRQQDAQADHHRSDKEDRSANECTSKRGGAPGDQRDAKRRRHHFDAELKRLLELEFKCLLQEELNKLNDFVVDMEEEFIIKLQDFKEKTARLKEIIIEANDENHSDILNLQKDVVVFHGEMILLKNYMSLNYTGLVKIVKKHDRLTGAWLRMSFIPDVLRQPFYNTDILSRLITDCESDLLSLFSSCTGETADCSELEMESLLDSAFLDDRVFNDEILRTIHKSTMTALKVIRKMAGGSSTYSVYSMPPCEDNEDAGSEI